MRRMERRNSDLIRTVVPPEATREQFTLLQRYLACRHSGGGMSDMGLFDYVAMVEETPIDTILIEYRVKDADGRAGPLVACALSDVLQDGLSMVYSFFDPALSLRSLGTYMILDHVRAAQIRRLPYRLSRLLGARQPEDGLQVALSSAGGAWRFGMAAA